MKSNFRSLFIIFAGLALLAGILACNLPVAGGQPASAPPTAIPTVPSNQMQPTIETKGQQVTVTVSEAQLTTIVADQLSQQQDAPLTDPQVSLQNGQITLTGRIRQSSLSLPLKMVMTVTADANGQPHYQVVSATLGPMPLPQSILDQLTTQLDQQLSQQLTSKGGKNLFIEKIDIANRQMVVTGHPRS